MNTATATIDYPTASGRTAAEPRVCFHCGEAIADGIDINLMYQGKRVSMCCYGCESVCSTIIESGLDDYYQHRESYSSTARPLIPEELEKLSVFNNQTLQQKWLEQESSSEQHKTMNLVLEGIVCPACAWLNEKTLAALPGMLECTVNYTNNRASIRWDDDQLQLDTILKTIRSIGYEAWPYKPETEALVSEKERRAQLWRLGLCGILGMQVMMISIALYFGDYTGIDAEYRQLFAWLNLAFTTPVLLISGAPFLQGAIRDIQHRRLGMDVPVSLGLLSAYSASVWSTASAHGEIYYDSVVMFIFLLSLSRYLEFMQRRKAIQEITDDNELIPATATQIRTTDDGSSREHYVAVVELQAGDVIRVKAGETIPADGIITRGNCHVDESLLSGESLPVYKGMNDTVVAGSTNTDSPIEIQVQQTGDETVLASIHRLIEEAQAHKPRVIDRLNYIASWFIGFVIVIAGMTAAYYLNTRPEHWLEIVISVLVVTCPCALSMAIPLTHAATLARLLKRGVLLKNPDVLSTLNSIDTVIFDKTGTLTQANIQLDSINTYAHLDQHQCLQLAAALECSSEHPLARAITQANKETANYLINNVQNYPGKGISADINGVSCSIGSQAFIDSCLPTDAVLEPDENKAEQMTIYLAQEETLLAAFYFSDTLKDDALNTLQRLQAAGLDIHLLSGDRQATTTALARELNITQASGEMLPEDKLKRVKQLQAQQHRVLMIGDGINDAPVLSQADVSIAMGSGADIARMNSDMILLNKNLATIVELLDISRKNQRIIKQSLSWAIAYNLCALPLAMAAFLLPWMAAIGMSLSSLLVVLNARRMSS